MATKKKPTGPAGVEPEVDPSNDTDSYFAEDDGPVATPMFPGARTKKIPAETVVYRHEPEAGDYAYMGTLGASATEHQVQAAFGGGKYKLRLRAEDGSILAETKPFVLWGERFYPGQAPAGGGPAPVEGEAATREGGPAYREVLAMQKQMAAESRELAKQTLAEQREAAKAERDLRRQEMEWQLAALEAKGERERKEWEAKADRERKEAAEKHDRDMERERERRAAEAQTSREFMATMQSLQKDSTAIMVAALQRDTAGGKTAELVQLMAVMKDMLNPEVDPMVEVTKTVGGAVGNLATLAQNEMQQRRMQLQAANGARAAPVVVKNPRRAGGAAAAMAKGASGAAPAAPAALAPASDDPGAILSSLSEKLTAAGLDPIDVLRKLDSGELGLGDATMLAEIQAGKLGVFELDEHGEPLMDEDETPGQTPENAPAGPAPAPHGPNGRGGESDRPGAAAVVAGH